MDRYGIAQGPEKAREHVLSGIDLADIQGAAKVYKQFADDLGTKRGKLRHRVFHGFQPTDPVARHLGVRPDFCSVFAQELFAKMLVEAQEASAQELLAVLSPTQSMRSTIFESLLIQRFAHKQHLETFVNKRDETLAGGAEGKAFHTRCRPPGSP